jgi:hypothetical protein
VAAVAGLIAWWIGDRSQTAFVITAWLVLTVQILAIIPLLVLAFHKFDPSVDTPA